MSTTEVSSLSKISDSEVYGGSFESLFRGQLEPLYGDQSVALGKIANGEDRNAYVLGEISQPLGVLVIKNLATTEEYGNFSMSGIEIKTLTLFNPDSNSGKGLGRALIDRAFEHVREYTQPENGVPDLFVTVSSDKPESLHFFGKHGFVIAHSVPGAYRDGNTEHVLTHDNNGL